MADQSVELLLKARNLTAEAFSAVTAAMKQLEEQSDRTTTKGKSSWTSWFTTIAGGAAVGDLLARAFSSVSGLLAEIPGKLIELGARGADVADLQDHFQRLNEEIGETADVSLAKMRTAFGGTVSDFDLMKSANEALSHGLKLTGDDFAVIAQTARISADAVGGSAKGQYDALLQSIATGRERGLKNLPLDFAAITKSVQDHAAALGTDVAHLSEHEHALALRNAVLEQGKRLIQETGGVENDFADNVARGKAMLDNWSDSLGLAIAKSPALKELMSGIEDGLDQAFGATSQDRVKNLRHLVDLVAVDLANVGIIVTESAGYIRQGVFAINTELQSLAYTQTAAFGAVVQSIANVANAAALLPGELGEQARKSAEKLNIMALAAEMTRRELAREGVALIEGAKGHGEFFDKINRGVAFMTALRDRVQAAADATDNDTAATKKAIPIHNDWGAAVEGGSDAAVKAATKVRELTAQIEAASARGMSASQIISTFGKDALQASAEAQKAGVTSSKAIEQIATSAVELAAAWDSAASSQKLWQALQENPASKAALAGEQANIDLVLQMAQVDQDRTIQYAAGTQQRLLQIEKERQGQIDALNKMSGASETFKRERLAQIDEVAQHDVDVATGAYRTIVERMQAAGIATRADLALSARDAKRDYEQMAASGQFSADAVQAAWERSIHAQALAIGGFKGDLLNMYADLSGQLAGALGHMLTHVKGWRDDLKSIWHSIQDDFGQVLASMLKRWIEGFLMKLLDSITGSRGAFQQGFRGLLGGGLGSLLGAGTAVAGPGALAGTTVTSGVWGGGAGAGAAGGIGAGLSGILGGIGAGGAGLGIGFLAQHLFGGAGAASGAVGAGGGAATGALIGSIVPGIGTAIGALIGGLSGLFGGLFGKSKGAKANDERDTFFQQFGAEHGGFVEGTQVGSTYNQVAAKLTDITGEAGGGHLFDDLVKANTVEKVKAAVDAVTAALAKEKSATDATAQATSDAVDAQKAKYGELKASVLSQIDDVNKSLDDLNRSEKPEAHMGTIEKQARAHLEAQKDMLQKQLQDIETAAAEAIKAAGKVAGDTVNGLAGPIAQLPEDFYQAGRRGAIRFKDGLGDLDIDTIHIPYRYDAQNGLPDGPDSAPIPHARGGLFSGEHIARIAEGGQSEIVGDQGFMTKAVAGAMQTLGLQGIAPGGGGVLNLTINALDGADVLRVVQGSAFKQAFARVFPYILTDNLEGVRTNSRLALGVTG